MFFHCDVPFRDPSGVVPGPGGRFFFLGDTSGKGTDPTTWGSHLCIPRFLSQFTLSLGLIVRTDSTPRFEVDENYIPVSKFIFYLYGGRTIMNVNVGVPCVFDESRLPL